MEVSTESGVMIDDGIGVLKPGGVLSATANPEANRPLRSKNSLPLKISLLCSDRFLTKVEYLLNRLRIQPLRPYGS